MDALNHSLFVFFNADPDTAAWAITTGKLVAKRVIYLIPLMLMATWLWGNTAQRNTALQALLTTLLALGCNHVIGLYVHTPRPFELGLGHTFLAHAATASFPSNHLTIFMCIGLSMYRGAMPRWGAAVLAAGTVVAWARVFVGVHFPADMAGAVVVAVVFHIAVTPVWRRYGHAVTAHAERVYRRVLAAPIAAGWLRN